MNKLLTNITVRYAQKHSAARWFILNKVIAGQKNIEISKSNFIPEV